MDQHTEYDFCEAAYLNKEHSPWRKRREDGGEYAMFKIVDCEHDSWWYAPYIGVEFLGKIKRDYLSKEIKEIVACRGFKLVTMNLGRSVSPEDVILM